MKPTPLPPNPTWLDRIEHALQWVTSWTIVDLEGKSALSGVLIGLIGPERC